jgi:transaldolase
MKATQQIYRAGQSLWLDNITRDLLTSGTRKRYIEEPSVTGLTSLGVIASKSAALAKAS